MQSVEHLEAAAAAPPSAGGVHTDTFLILAAVLCFLLCVVGLAFVARCSRLCNPSAFSVDADADLAAAAACKGIKRKALDSMPTVSWARPEQEGGDEEERPECAICLAEFARGDTVRVLPACGHGFHAACVDAWLVSSSTCPSCRRTLVVSTGCAGAGADVEAQASGSGSGSAAGAGRCRSSAP